MGQFEKAVERLKARPPEADINDVERVLEGFGWTRIRQRGSHVIFRKPGERTQVIPLVGGRRVKRPYLDEICRRLGLDD